MVAAYRMGVGSNVIRAIDGATIPDDPDNADRAEFDAWVAAGGVPDPAAGSSLDDVKARRKVAIDAAAERERLKYLTPGEGQALVYEAKRTEVARWRNLAEGDAPDAARFPWAADRAERLDVTIPEVLSVWAAQAAGWSAIGIAIERVREAAKEAVTAAASVEATEAVEVIWPEM